MTPPPVGNAADRAPEPTPEGAGSPVRPARLFRRVLVTVAGVIVCLVGIVLLVLPGPGLLLVLGGLVLLASENEWARRLTAPVRQQAMRAARQSVASVPRICASALCGLALIGVGITAIRLPTLPFAGTATGSSLILSGLVLLVLLADSFRRFRRRFVPVNDSTAHAADDDPHHG